MNLMLIAGALAALAAGCTLSPERAAHNARLADRDAQRGHVDAMGSGFDAAGQANRNGGN